MQRVPFLKKTKSKVFTLLYKDPSARLHMRAIERQTGERINAVREALLSLTEEKVIVSDVVGKKRFFQANTTNPYYDELLRIVARSTGLGARILSEKARLGKIKAACLTATYYRHEEPIEGSVDLFLVGSVSLKEISRIAAEEGEERKREINYSVMDADEYAYRLKNKDPFLAQILQQQYLILIGSL